MHTGDAPGPSTLAPDPAWLPSVTNNTKFWREATESHMWALSGGNLFCEAMQQVWRWLAGLQHLLKHSGHALI